jgi:hypothetical protein
MVGLPVPIIEERAHKVPVLRVTTQAVVSYPWKQRFHSLMTSLVTISLYLVAGSPETMRVIIVIRGPIRATK